MADKDLVRAGNTIIEAYEANQAVPTELPEMRFWLNNELKRIQATFFSVDNVFLKVLDLMGDGDGGEGVPGPPGPAGPQGPEGPEGPQGPEGECECDPSFLIADGEVRTDRTWSSFKINDELSAKSDIGHTHDWWANIDGGRADTVYTVMDVDGGGA